MRTSHRKEVRDLLFCSRGGVRSTRVDSDETVGCEGRLLSFTCALLVDKPGAPHLKIRPSLDSLALRSGDLLLSHRSDETKSIIIRPCLSLPPKPLLQELGGSASAQAQQAMP